MHSDPSKPSAHSLGVLHDAAPEGVDPVLARRLLLLRGLGKGAAAAAALSPLASQATRNYTLHNPIVDRTGYCSVSGFQSAAISVAPGQSLTTCEAKPPSAFFDQDQAAYDWESSSTVSQNRTNHRAAVRALLVSYFGFTVAEANAVGNGRIDGLAVTNTPQIIAGALYLSTVYANPAANGQIGSGTIRQIKASTNYPTVVANARPLRYFENMMDNVPGSGNVDNANAKQSVLYTLYDVQTNNKAYFAAVALGCIREDNAFQSSGGFTAGLIPFDAKYVGDMYNDPAKQADAGVFFKTLCGH
jgi:hypothetical protein